MTLGKVVLTVVISCETCTSFVVVCAIMGVAAPVASSVIPVGSWVTLGEIVLTVFISCETGVSFTVVCAVTSVAASVVFSVSSRSLFGLVRVTVVVMCVSVDVISFIVVITATVLVCVVARGVAIDDDRSVDPCSATRTKSDRNAEV